MRGRRVISKLLYGLESFWLLEAERTKLNGFYAKCLRRIHCIPPSFVSRVSNKTVLGKAGTSPLSNKLLQRQLLLFGRVARQPSTSLLRQLTFEPGSLQPKRWNYKRKVGRPRLQWTSCVHSRAREAAGIDFESATHNPSAWASICAKNCSNLT